MATVFDLFGEIKLNGMGDVEKGLDGLKGKLGGIGTGMKTAGIAVAGFGLAAVGAGIASAKAFASTADGLDEMSIRTGLSTTALQELGYAAKLTGSSMGGVETAVKKMQVTISGGVDQIRKSSVEAEDKILALQDQMAGIDPKAKGAAEKIAKLNAQIDEIASSTENAENPLSKLGLSLMEISTKSPEEQFKTILYAIANLKDPTVRAATAVEIFGRAGTDMLPMLAEGSVGLEKMRKEANDLGIVMDEASIKSGASFQDAMDKLEMALGGVVNQIGVKLIPVLEPIIPLFMDLIKALPIKEFGQLLNSLLPPLVNLFTRLLKAIPLDVVIKFVQTALVPLFNILDAILPVLEPILRIFSSLLSIITPIVDVLGRVLSFIAQILGSGITSVLNGIAGLFGGSMGGFRVPSFAGYEGIIPGAKGTPIPAIVHAGEYIGQGNSSGNQSFNFYLDGEPIRAVIEKRMNNNFRLQEVTGY